MKQKYGIAFVLFNFSFLVSLTQAIPVVHSSSEEVAKSHNTNLKPNEFAEPNKNLEASPFANTSEVVYNKSEETFENSAILKNTNNTDVTNCFDSDFLPLEQRMPVFTEEEYSEINKEGATPWNFLKYIDNRKNVDATQPRAQQNTSATQIYINIPIVINSDTALPISLTIGGKYIPLKATGATTHDSLLIKLKDYKKTPNRETNRHRSNFNTIVYAHNQSEEREDVSIDKQFID